jgi:MOSC domain-containing protein YiiM
MLEDRSFNAVIADGQIRHEENLRPWEGKAVQVTVHSLAREEIALPDDFDVERDVYVKMPVETTLVGRIKNRDIGSD